MLRTILGDTWTFFVAHFSAIAAIVLPITIIVSLLSSLYAMLLAGNNEYLNTSISIALEAASIPIYAAAVVFYIAAVLSGSVIEVKTAWRLGLKFWFPYLVMFIVTSIVIMLGLLLLVLPGIYLVARYAFAEIDLLLNKRKPMEAIHNSWRMTEDHLWLLFAGNFVIFMVTYLPQLLLAPLAHSFWFIDFAIEALLPVFYSLHTVLAFRVYEIARSEGGSSQPVSSPN